MEDRKSSPLTEDPSLGSVEQLDGQQKTLRDFLESIEDDARLMDASAEDAHQIAVSICKMVKQSIFGPDGALDRSSYQAAYNIFERTRADENDIYEVYADDLQRATRSGSARTSGWPNLTPTSSSSLHAAAGTSLR